MRAPQAQCSQPQKAAPTPRDRTLRAVALFVLLDQIPRHLYRTRDTLPLVYTQYDRLARALASELIVRPGAARPDLAAGMRDSAAYRCWFYMPLMHSERVEHHRSLVRILGEWEEELKSEGKGEDVLQYLQTFREHENKHKEIVERFGRFPHRNAVLERESTREEIEWLEAGGETFGVSV